MGPANSYTILYNPMTHGGGALLYNIVQPHDPWGPSLLYNPMTHGALYPLYNVVWPHDPWGFVTIAAPMTYVKKVAEPCEGIDREWTGNK